MVKVLHTSKREMVNRAYCAMLRSLKLRLKTVLAEYLLFDCIIVVSTTKMILYININSSALNKSLFVTILLDNSQIMSLIDSLTSAFHSSFCFIFIA